MMIVIILLFPSQVLHSAGWFKTSQSIHYYTGINIVKYQSVRRSLQLLVYRLLSHTGSPVRLASKTQ